MGGCMSSPSDEQTNSVNGNKPAEFPAQPPPAEEEPVQIQFEAEDLEEFNAFHLQHSTQEQERKRQERDRQRQEEESRAQRHIEEEEFRQKDYAAFEAQQELQRRRLADEARRSDPQSGPDVLSL